MPTLHDLVERVERLVLRHEELKRTRTLMAQQLAGVTQERDSLRSRLAAARARIDALLARLPAEVQDPAQTPAPMPTRVETGPSGPEPGQGPA